MNASQIKAVRDKLLRETISQLKPETANELRDAYYQAADGVLGLLEALKKADAECAENMGTESLSTVVTSELQNAHYVEMYFSKSQLGRVL